jgi:Ca2+-binding EF-hand superfamily protein
VERKREEARAKEENEKAYNNWLAVKDLREQAVKLLSFLPALTADGVSSGSDATADGKRNVQSGSRVLGAKGVDSRTSLVRSSMGSLTGKKSKSSKADQIDNAIDVGKSLKRVDRSLFTEWSAWCVPHCLSYRVAAVLWDCFEPKACDVHSAAYSQVRETFSKLLKPGVDYKQKFTDFATKLMKRRQMQADSKEEKEKYMGELSLSKKTLQDLLLELGIVMKPAEMLVLVDAFDGNGDGVITMQEFLEFTGPKRDRKGGTSLQLNQRCSWLTTCRVTGMANGYAVSAVSSKARLNAWADDKVNDSKGSHLQDSGAEQFEGITGKMIIKTLKNGEKRMCAEMAERKKREDLLRKFGLLNDKDDDVADEKKSCGDEEKNDYEDEYDDEFGADKDKHGSTGGAESGKDKCPFICWSVEDRKLGVAHLMELTAEARQVAWINEKMSSGQPPSKPNLDAESPQDLMERDETFDPTTELQLCWSPGSKGDLVSFFLLEFAGATGGLLRSESYKEICRDPSSASPDATFDCTFRKSGLEPGVSYAFRVRAYNGYGPGQFVYKTFTTLTAAPQQPRVVKLTHDAVQLRWIFSKNFKEKMAELKELFFSADNDNNGTLSREELTRAVENASDSVLEFLTSLAKRLKLDDWGLLFDKIEGDENGTLSWEEFEQFFMTAGWADDDGSVQASGSLRASSAAQLRSSGSLVNAGAATSSMVSKVTYRIEKCVSEKNGREVFETAQDTNNGTAMISRLIPGQSYKFRVVGVNAEGQVGMPSENVIVHTMLETPAAPVVNPKSIQPTRIIINWRARRSHQSSRDQSVVSKMIEDWAGTAGTEDTGVNVVEAFKKYDK